MKSRINTYTDTSITFGLLDQNAYCRFDNESTQTVTIPASQNVNFPVRTQIYGVQANTGQLVFQAENGVIVNAKSSTSPEQNSQFSLIKYDIDKWDLIIF